MTHLGILQGIKIPYKIWSETHFWWQSIYTERSGQ